MNLHFSELLQLLTEEGAEYLVIGGYAVIRYTEPRYTKDFDVLVGNSSVNAPKVHRALARFGAPLGDLTIEDLQTPELFFQIGLPPNRIDIITTVPGVDFSAAYGRRERVVIDDREMWFISREDLISAKLAAGRPQDLVDAGALVKRKRE